MLLVDVEEVWDRHTHLVRAPNEVCFALGQVIFKSFRILIVANCLFDRVRDLRKRLLVFLENELLLLDFDLLGLVDLAFDDDRLNHERYDKAFDRVLLLVDHLHAHVSTGLDLILFNQLVSAKLIPGDGPKVGEDQHAIYSYRENEAD